MGEALSAYIASVVVMAFLAGVAGGFVLFVLLPMAWRHVSISFT